MSFKEFFLLCWHNWQVTATIAFSAMYVLACLVFVFKKETHES